MTLRTQISDAGDLIERVTINGEVCMGWLFNSPDTTITKKAEQDRRKKIKDVIGPRHPDTVLLDSFSNSSGERQYCDIIIYTEHVIAWQEALCHLYASDTDLLCTLKGVTSGDQLSWHRQSTNSPYVSISFYPSKNKILIQPGDREEGNLIQWIGEFRILKSSVASSGTASSSPSSTTMLAQPAYVKLPLLKQTAASPSSLNTPPNDRMIHSELLCFLQSKSETIPVTTLSKLIVDFYASDVIVDAQKLLFSSVNTSRRLTSRKGDDKSINDVGDMLKVILELKGDAPQFVAHDLSNIPPVSINNFDILHLRDIQDIKSQMNMLTNGHSDLSKCVKALTTNVAQQSTSMLPPPTPTTCEARPYYMCHLRS
jgi:hypothetical protein